jgi:hypothetical protein
MGDRAAGHPGEPNRDAHGRVIAKYGRSPLSLHQCRE